jgi:hypothetical protein
MDGDYSNAKRFCSNPGCDVELSIYNKKDLCFKCQDGGEERVFDDRVCYGRCPRSGGKVVSVNIKYHG